MAPPSNVDPLDLKKELTRPQIDAPSVVGLD
jgi:hypothetical protein